ncbi:MAG: hypothetical protein GX277_02165 [Bacteroidales bacterium]|nr:hypothetical protein [Bacteroidales bacterium]
MENTFDTIMFKNKITPVIQMYSEIDTVGSEIWNHTINSDSTFIYNNFCYIRDSVIKLLQYTTVYKDGTRRIWRLKE